MKLNLLKKTSFLSLILFMAAIIPFSCGKSQPGTPGQNSIELSDLLGTWEFNNTITDAFNRELIGEQMTVTLHNDLTYTVPDVSQPTINRFAFTSDVFRLVIHRGIPMTHLNFYFIFEGEMANEGLLSGKIYSTSPSMDKDPMSYMKGSELGSFTASLVSD